jgi:hypothetical protein
LNKSQVQGIGFESTIWGVGIFWGVAFSFASIALVTFHKKITQLLLLSKNI